jgi:N-acetylglucosamine kinase-like BadF-type ATPase
MDYVLGVDGGNTKTVALVARTDGEVVGVGRAGCGDIYGAASEEAALAEIERAVRDALAMGGVSAMRLVAGGFSMAGADWPEDFAFFEAAMTERGFGRTITVVNDAIGALRAGSAGPAVSVVCGTGVATGARGLDGTYWHTSFWQEGGGSGRLSSETFRAVTRAELGIDPPTSLTGALLTAFDLPTVEAWLHVMTARRRPRPPAATTIARLLLDAAEAGDGVAQDIVRAEGERMGDYALAAARKVGLTNERFDLVLAGGVFDHPSPLLPGHVTARVRRDIPLTRPVRPALEPAAGAVLLAFDAANVPASSIVVERLDASLVLLRSQG